MTKDSILFIGSRNVTQGLLDMGNESMLATQFPIGFGSSFQMITYNISSYPISFKRGNRIYGNNVNILFTPREEVLSIQISVYPNPGNDKIRIQGITAPSVLTMYTLQGKVVLEKALDAEAELEIQTLPKGLYYINITSGSKRKMLTWVKD